MRYLKILIFFNFIIFALPFLKTCSGVSVQEKASTFEVLTEKSYSEPKKQNIYKNTFSVYELVGLWGEDLLENFELPKDKEDFYFWLGLLFLAFILLINVIILFLSFCSKILKIIFLSVGNLILLCSSILSFYIAGILEEISQLEIGFYLHLMSNILVILISLVETKYSSNIRYN